MLQTEQTAAVRDLFCLFWARGVSLGAFAQRCGIPAEKLTRELAGLGEWPDWVALDDAPRAQLLRGLNWLTPKAKHLGDGYRILYCATRALGSLRWHHWLVANETLPHIVGREADDLICFSTIDGLTVALNPQHVVTMLYGEEDIDCLVEPSAIVPSQSTTGALVPYHEQLNVLEHEFRTFREAVREWDGFDYNALPFSADMRAPRAFLLDLHQPFMDHSLREDAVTEGEGQLKLPQHQVTVLECPLHLQERATHRFMLENIDTSMSATEYRAELAALGLYSAQELEHMKDEYSKELVKHPTHKRRRPRKHPAAFNAAASLSKV